MDDPLWYKTAVLYELHVRTFFDGNGDGIGDFRGLLSKLDYLQDLGVTALWLLPFYPSPLKDDGYDIADYRGVHPAYGTLIDFQAFLKETHRRGLKVVTELVLNHTSDQHPWFQRARRAKRGSSERNFYVWSTKPDRYQEARIIFKDFEKSNWSWDAVARAYYWHRFYAHQPDLNYDHPPVRRAVQEVADFWLEMGVDGLRLDAVPYLFEREETNCENLPESHAFLKELRAHVDHEFKNRMLLAEANQWPEEARTYFGEGDECHMAFHFPVMPRLFMAIRLEDRFPIADILQQTSAVPENCQWALFLRNHDELTLEMVTDEERDYMWRVYALDLDARINLGIRRRLAPLLGNHRRKMELMNGLLFSLPGSPILYYGDEIGMGDNVALPDRSGVRTPMQWSPDRNAGFSRASARKLCLPVITDSEYSYETINVAFQEKNPHSLLWQMRRLIALRKEHPAFGIGTMEFLHPGNAKILAFLRRTREETLLVAANLSRFVQAVELDLSAFKGLFPVEMFGAGKLPVIGEKPYFLTLGPHAFYWFTLEKERPLAPTAGSAAPPVLELRDRWEELIGGREKAVLEAILPDFLRRQRWFGGKARSIRTVRLRESVRIPWDSTAVFWTLLDVQYDQGEPEIYALPLTFLPAESSSAWAGDSPAGTVAKIRLMEGNKAETGFLLDALSQPAFCRVLWSAFVRGRCYASERTKAEWRASPAADLRTSGPACSPKPFFPNVEQSNTSIFYGQEWVLKVFRKVEEGIHPDLEISQFLTKKTQFRHFPALGGSLETLSPGRRPISLAVLHRFVPNEGDAWSHTLEVLGRFFEEVLTRPSPAPEIPGSIPALAEKEIPKEAQEKIGPFLDSARLLGRRTAQLHGALASGLNDPAFRPEPFSEMIQRSFYETMRGSLIQTIQLLRARMTELPADVQAEAQEVLRRESGMTALSREILRGRIGGMRIRCHGDYHLGQVLYTGKDFFIMDFEGEPARSLSDRRIKRSPLKDVAGMLRSFHYAAHAVLFARDAGHPIRPEDLGRLEGWAQFWRIWVSVAFLQGYLREPGLRGLLPSSSEGRAVLLRVFLLEKALYEVRYELNHRPDWIRIPLRGILHLLGKEG